MQQAIDYINKKIEKYSKMVEISKKVYEGNESKFTFHGGQSYGYEQGKLSAFEDMKDKLQALHDGWIPVTDRLPEEGIVVLGYIPTSKKQKVTIVKKGMYSWWLGYGSIKCNPTHWMPLPNSPKQ